MTFTPVEALAGQLQREQINRALGEAGRLTFALGPIYINDLPANATTGATWAYFNTATALSRDSTNQRLGRAGRVVGIIMASDNPRTAGTATARARINGVGTDFNGGACKIDATNTQSFGSFVAWDDGVPFAADEGVGLEVVSASWGPITANLTMWAVVQLEAL